MLISPERGWFQLRKYRIASELRTVWIEMMQFDILPWLELWDCEVHLIKLLFSARIDGVTPLPVLAWKREILEPGHSQVE